MMRVVVVGSGNVASVLAGAVADCVELELVQIYARNALRAEEIAVSCNCNFACTPEQLASADLYIVAVSDVAVAAVCQSLNFGEGVVAHTAGSVDLTQISPDIVNAAVLYPLQTFTRGRKINMSEVPLLIEARSAKALECVRCAASALSLSVHELNSKQRAKVHVAAVFASNFTNHMYAVAESLLNEANLPFELLKPLILETAMKALSAQSPVATQTGPAIRNDFKTKSQHCEMLREKPDLKNIYITLSKNIWEISKKI